MRMAPTLFAAAFALLPASLFAQPAAPAEQVAHLVIYGRDACPRGREGEIIICARHPESERYRIPRQLRDQGDQGPEGTSWAEKAQSLEYVGRTGTQSCSPIGAGGWTGCWAQMMREARQERAHPESNNTPP
jgi:hypothetical protein